MILFVLHCVTLCIISVTSFLAVPTARAAYRVDIRQVGPDVVATGSGSIDLTNLTISATTNTVPSYIVPNQAVVQVGPTSLQNVTDYKFVGGPSSFGPGAFAKASSGSGASVGVFGNTVVTVPQGYVSGTDLGISTATWSNQTFSSLGLTPGIFVEFWGVTSPHADTFTIVAPEPASLSLLAIAGPMLLRRRRSA